MSRLPHESAAEKTAGASDVVSVVIPAYNSARYIGQAIDSALDQRGLSVEIVVVDDGSTDDTARVLEAWRDRVRCVRQPNGGQSAARNTGLRVSRGKYVLFLDADDYLLPGALADLAERLDAQPALGMIQGGTRYVDAQGRTMWDEEPWHEAPRLDLETCVRRHPVQISALVVRRQWAERVEGFDVALKRAPDVDFLLRLALAGCPMEWLRQPVLCYRQHDGNITTNAVEQAEGLTIVLDKFFARSDVPAHIKALERGVRFYTTVWATWRMTLTGQADAIPAWLERTLVYAPFPPEEAALEWVRQFAGHDARAGRPRDAVNTWLPQVRRALQSLGARGGARSDALLVWWAKVWVHYLDDDSPDAAHGLDAFRQTPWPEVLALAQESVRLSPAQRRIEASERFWADATAAGLVVPARARDVTRLYLTAFGQAATSRDWQRARAALGRAVGVGLDRRAALAWLWFARNGLTHAVRRFGGQRE